MNTVLHLSELCLSILIGILTAGICWFFANFVFIPHIEISNLNVSKRKKRYVLISNYSKYMNAYEVMCYVNYYVDGKLMHTRCDNLKPILTSVKQKGSTYIVRLDGLDDTNALFEEAGNLELYIVVSCQNKFGVKKSLVKTLMVLDDGDNN